MAWRRVIYAILLIASVAAFIITDSAVALFVMLILFAVLPSAYIMLFIAKRRVRFDFSTRESCMRGNAIQLDMKASVKPRFLVGYVKVIAEIENSTFNNTELVNFTFQDLSYSTYTHNYVCRNSGRIRVRIKKLRIIDIFGICAVDIACAKFSESFVAPVLYDGLQITIDSSGSNIYSGEIPVPKRGQDATEIFDVRDYVPGDSLKAVHWKLSSKFGALKTKEFGRTDDHKTLILVDLSRVNDQSEATDEQLNGVLDAAISVSAALKSGGYIHSVGWFNEGTFTYSDVLDNDSFLQMVNELMSIKVKEGNDEVLFYMLHAPECAAFTKVILIAAAANSEAIRNHGDRDITAIVVGNEAGAITEYGANIIDVPYDDIGRGLAVRVL